MVNPTVKLVTSGKGLAPVLAGTKALERAAVYVGIPESAAARKSKLGNRASVTNAQLAFLLTEGVRSSDMRRIVSARMQRRGESYELATKMYVQSHGSPRMQTPPRPIIQPAIEAAGNHEKIEHELAQAAAAALDGRTADVHRFMDRAGLVAQNLVRAWFVDPRNHWAPNAPSTIRRKGSANPNIDTAQLRKAITYLTVK